MVSNTRTNSDNMMNPTSTTDASGYCDNGIIIGTYIEEMIYEPVFIPEEFKPCQFVPKIINSNKKPIYSRPVKKHIRNSLRYKKQTFDLCSTIHTN